jgi:hypothetical protein
MISERPSPQERSQDALYYDYKRVNLLVRISWASEDMDSSGASANPGRGFGISEFRRLSRFYGVFGAVFQNPVPSKTFIFKYLYSNDLGFFEVAEKSCAV